MFIKLTPKETEFTTHNSNLKTITQTKKKKEAAIWKTPNKMQTWINEKGFEIRKKIKVNNKTSLFELKLFMYL